MHVGANPGIGVNFFLISGVAINFFSFVICIYVDAPRITIELSQSPLMVMVGEVLFLTCIAKGLPIPTIRWYENNVLIPQQSSLFHLVSTDVPGTTSYICEGRNNAGNMLNIAQANITVVVKRMI